MHGQQATFVMLVTALCITTAVQAQEMQVPIDSAGQLEVIDARVARQLVLFREYDGFIEARLFQTPDSSYVLEITYQPADRVLRERKPLTTPDVADLRADVTRRMRAEMPTAGLDQEGRAELVAGTTSLALGYHGWAVPLGMGVEDGRGYVGFYLIASSAGFLIPFLATQTTSVTEGEAILALHGGTRGIAHGIFLWLLFGGGTEDENDRGLFVTGSAVSIAEEIIWFQIADRSKMSAGKAALLGVGDDFGMAFGAGAAQLAGAFEGDDDERLWVGMILTGGALGIWTANGMSKAHVYSEGDASVVRTAGILGAGIPMVILDIANTEDEDSYFAAGMAGLLIGSGVGHRLTRHVNFTAGQGRLIMLGTMGGGLFGLGLATLASSEHGGSPLFTSLTAIGATAVFAMMYKSFEDDARISETGSPSWKMQFAPEAMTITDQHRMRVVPGIRVGIRF